TARRSAHVPRDVGCAATSAGSVRARVTRVALRAAAVAAPPAGALMAPAVAQPVLSAIPLAAMVVAIAAGAITFSHVNDSGYWLIGRFCGFDTVTTFKTWTVVGTAIGFMAFALCWGLFALTS